MPHRIVTNYFLRSPKLHSRRCLAVAADLHNSDYEDLLPVLHSVDAILVPGDLVDRHRHRMEHAMPFLKAAVSCAPTYYSVGNHERIFPCTPDYWEEAAAAGAVILDNTIARAADDLVLGGLSSAEDGGLSSPAVSLLEQEEGFRLLLCHHPEYYPACVAGRGIDLTVSGHAHGGQIVLFGHALYAPGQGIFPRYTSGFYEDNHLLVSRGLVNSTFAPRIKNPCELILLHLIPPDEETADAE